MEAIAASAKVDRLQWGHGLGAVDDVSDSRPEAKGATLQWGHGLGAVDDEALVHRVPHQHNALQWGHGLGAVDDILTVVGVGFMLLLQWGHGLGAVDDDIDKLHRLRGVLLQWGHGLGAVDDRTTPSATSAGTRRFNGATALGPWMTLPEIPD